MTRSTASGRLCAPASSKRQPAHRAPRRPPLQATLPTGPGTTLACGISSLSRFGLAAVLGSALVAAGQLPASAAQGAAVKAAPVAVAAPRAASTATPTAAARRVKIIKIAKRYVGVRYVRGGTKPRPGFDCSGYTRYVVKQAGTSLPRTSRQQYAQLRKVAKSQRKPGDLIFFKSSGGRVFHVGIYAGSGKMYDSPRPGKRVALRKIWSSRVSYGRIA